MNKRILNAEDRLEAAKKNLDKIIKDVQLKCSHPKDFVYEAEYKPATDFFYAQPPFRVCSKCGLSETGWGIGYYIMPDTDLKISRDKGYEINRYMIYEEEKCNIKFKKANLHQKFKEKQEVEAE